MIPINTVDECIVKIGKWSRMIPDSGYNVVSLKVGFNKDGSTYPSLALLKYCKSWEEAEGTCDAMSKEYQGIVDRVIILPPEKRSIEPPYKSTIERILDDIEHHTPPRGYNLCELDDFEEPGEMLYFKSHHATYEEALEAKADVEGPGSNDRYIIYPSRRLEEGL